MLHQLLNINRLTSSDNITSTALFYVENAQFQVVNFSNVLLCFVDDFDKL